MIETEVMPTVVIEGIVPELDERPMLFDMLPVVEVEPAFPDLPIARVKLLDALCHECQAPVTVWRTAVGLLRADRRVADGDAPATRHVCRGLQLDLAALP